MDEICDIFEQQWARGDFPAAETYLNRVPSEEQGELLMMLLEIELEYRIHRGEVPEEREYQRRYRNNPASVRRAFRAVHRRFPEAFPRTPAPAHPQPGPTLIDPNAEGKTPKGPDDGNERTIAFSRDSTVVLNVTSGPSRGLERRFTTPATCIVGRAADADLRLSPNRELSRYHCRLHINPPNVTLMDLGSTNGTLVNGEKVQECMLVTGDLVTTGDSTFRMTVIHPDYSPAALGDTILPTPSQQPVVAEKADSFMAHAPEVSGYIIDHVLGSGSMGTVYAARRIATNEKVAIKVTRPILDDDRKVLERFRREISIGLRLQHRYIVKTLDVQFLEDHYPCLIMEFVEQVDPRTILSDAPVKDRCRMACGIVVRLLEGLQYAHDLEFVHRDVKPSNLLIFRSGRKLQVKLADFGLAKNYVDAGFSDISRTGEMCGTVAYMPPEQIKDCRASKPSCDIYAAGVTLYNLISGKVPYTGSNLSIQVREILDGTPIPLKHFVQDVPDTLCQIIEKATMKDAEDRFASAAEMRHALLPFTRRET